MIDIYLTRVQFTSEIILRYFSDRYFREIITNILRINCRKIIRNDTNESIISKHLEVNKEKITHRVMR